MLSTLEPVDVVFSFHPRYFCCFFSISISLHCSAMQIESGCLYSILDISCFSVLRPTKYHLHHILKPYCLCEWAPPSYSIVLIYFDMCYFFGV